MGLLDLFKKPAAKGGGRVCTIAAPQKYVYDALVKVLAKAAKLDEESIEHINGALAPLAKVSGGKVTDLLKSIEVHVDNSRRPEELIVNTRMGGSPLGPSSHVKVEAIQAKLSRVTLRADIGVSNARLVDRMLMAGLSKKMATGMTEGVDDLLRAAAAELKAKIEFIDEEKK